MEGKSLRNQAADAQPVSWMIWQGPGRGYVVLETGLPVIADALEALWSLRAQRHQLDMLLTSGAIPGPIPASGRS